MKIGVYSTGSSSLSFRIMFDSEDAKNLNLRRNQIPVAELVQVGLDKKEYIHIKFVDCTLRDRDGVTASFVKNGMSRQVIDLLGIKSMVWAVRVKYRINKPTNTLTIQLSDIQDAIVENDRGSKQGKLDIDAVTVADAAVLVTSGTRRVLSHEQVAKIAVLLTKFCIKGTYAEGHSNSTVAKQVGVETDQVANVHQTLFGKANPTLIVDVVLEKLQTLISEIKAMK